MIIKVLFFARLKEQLGENTMSVELPAGSDTDVLKLQLLAKGEQWQVLNDESILMALNQQHLSQTAMLSDGDEVAFFPPVTGG
ncbi:molybdopterin converting factor subunit 1 [Agarivorans aestuarii]|uniref:Molybdopterin synthase sulfur carrier subunit n=1 Tax=Agarivorans aestuarii TaxID=1563703 RepID=A0ABU7G1L7_9ALTE|nr:MULTISPECIES: molybdopterin converting factor subunit 1 [Agarivorans]MEE1673157.1 molybdopterin converting factor subunit 1 [Agarivorans aestuarii]